MEQSADQSADSKYRKLYRDEMRARERAESQLRRQEQMSLVSSRFQLTFLLAVEATVKPNFRHHDYIKIFILVLMIKDNP